MKLIECKLMAFTLIAIFITPAFSQEKVILTTHDLEFYSKVNAKGKLTGVAFEVVNCAFKKIGITAEYRVLPWSRAQKEVQLGDADGFFAGSQKDSRDRFAVMSEHIADQNWTWFYFQSAKIHPDDKSFKAKATVSSFLGANMLSHLRKLNYNVAAIPSNNRALAQVLILKRVDAILANESVMSMHLRKLGVFDKVERRVYKEKPLGVYFSKRFLNQYPEFLKKFNSEVPACRESVAELMAK